MSYTTGLSYKPKMKKELVELLNKGALVHMLEFHATKQVNDIDEENLKCFETFLNSYSGSSKTSGSISIYEGGAFYCAETDSFPAMPTSAIKTGFPFELFDESTNVGLIKDPETVKFSYLSCRDCFSEYSDISKSVNLINRIIKDVNLRNILVNLNKGSDGIYSDARGHCMTIPSIRKEEDEKALRDFFYNDFFNAYSNGHVPGTKEFQDSFIKAFDKKLDAMNEVGATTTALSDRAIVIYSKKHPPQPSSHANFLSHSQISGMNLAFLVQQAIKQRTGTELPIIHYIFKDLYQSPEIREVEVEPKKIIKNLKNDNDMKQLYERFLGKQPLKDLILGKQELILQ